MRADYAALRQAIRTPIVVYDGYMQGCPGVVNLVIDHADGGRQAGQYLKAAGHTRALCLADNNICMDKGANGRLCGGLWPRPCDPLAGSGAGPAPAAVL